MSSGIIPQNPDFFFVVHVRYPTPILSRIPILRDFEDIIGLRVWILRFRSQYSSKYRYVCQIVVQCKQNKIGPVERSHMPARVPIGIRNRRFL